MSSFSGKSNGRIIICGGIDDGSARTDKCYEYLNATNEWNQFTTMNEARSAHYLTQIDDNTFWIAGNSLKEIQFTNGKHIHNQPP